MFAHLEELQAIQHQTSDEEAVKAKIKFKITLEYEDY